MKHCLEGRALEHGFVSWVRAHQNSAAVCRSRCIRMLRADRTVDKVVAPRILASMQWYACELARDLQKTASVHIQFAEQTVWKAQDTSLSIDLRALQRRKEVWIEVKWTRDHLQTALASASEKVLEFQSIAEECHEWVLDKGRLAACSAVLRGCISCFS